MQGQTAQTNKKVVNRNGKTTATYTLKNGELNGNFTQYYPNGLIQCQGSITPQKKSGEQYWYFQNDKLWKIVEYSISFPYDHNFEGYVFNETVTEYWENSKTKSIIKYLNGREQLEKTLWYKNGNLSRQTILNPDGKHYEYTEFFENGQKKHVRSFLINEKDNIQDGVYQEWNEKGVLIREANIVNNKSNGFSHVWADNGQMTEEYWYENNLIVAQKMWTIAGKQILAYDKRDATNKITSVEFYPDKKTIRSKSYYKTYPLDDSIIKINFTEIYNDKGELTQGAVNYNRTVVACIAKKYFPNTSLSGEFKKDSLYINGIRNNFFEASIRQVKEQTFYSLKLNMNPAYNDRWFSQTVSFPTKSSDKEIKKITHHFFNKLERKFTNPKKVNPDYLTTKENFQLIEPYYLESVKKLFFDSVIVNQKLDVNGSGKYSVRFRGSTLHYEATFKDGLLDGITTLYLNDSAKLSESEYHYGLLHGTATEWFPNGMLASKTNYKFNRKVDETFYYTNGEKKAKSVFGIKDRPIYKYEWYDNGNVKNEIQIINVPVWNEYELRNEWYKNGNVKRFSTFKDSVIMTGNVFEDGKIKGYGYFDFKRMIFVSKNMENGRQYMEIKIPQGEIDTLNFDFGKYGIRIKGRAFRIPTSNDWQLEDMFGEKIQVDFSQLSFSETLPCDCRDWVEHNYYRMALLNYTKESSFLKYQLNFHQPINILSLTGGNPFGSDDAPKLYIIGKKYTFSSTFNVMKEVVIPLPDSSGILFSLSPCISKYAFSAYRISGEFRFGFPRETALTIWDPKTLAITFNASFLRQVDENDTPLKNEQGNYLPCMLLFNAKKVTYDSHKELDVTEPVLKCSRSMEIVGTGIIIQVNGLLPDLSSTFNYPDMDNAWLAKKAFFDKRVETLKIPKAVINDFRGAYLTSSVIKIPYSNQGVKNLLQFYGKDIAIGSNFIIGTFSLSAKKGSGNKYSIVDSADKKVTIDEKSLKENLIALGLKNFYFQYDAENAELNIHFYYTK